MHMHVRKAVLLTQARPKNSAIHISILSAEFGTLVPFYMFLYFLDFGCRLSIFWYLKFCIDSDLILKWVRLNIEQLWAMNIDILTGNLRVCTPCLGVKCCSLIGHLWQLLSVWLHMYKLSFTPTSWPEFLSFRSVVYAWPLPKVTSTTIVIKICTTCGQPAIDDLQQTRNKLPCVLQLQSSQLQVTDAALWQ